ncbi:MAG: ABC transporter permease [Gammaproteobacteria bacterium]|nr:ABC transporter permease [Gammaproteobacteria bacterium]
MNNIFYWPRFVAMFYKEFTQMRRDRVTFAMLIGIPIIQLTLFGFAINTNPKHLPTAVVNGDISPFTRTFVAAMQNSEYFYVIDNNASEKKSDEMLARGDVNFVVQFPPNFSRDLVRGNQPEILITVDATDPIASVNAVTSISNLTRNVFNYDLQHGLSYLLTNNAPANVIIHAKYNPEAITQYNIVPALMGVVLTMTLVMITALAITLEREKGTYENLLSTPVTPLEVMAGKVFPYIIVGYIQMLLIIIASHTIFKIPFEGSLPLLLIATLPFISANLSVGITISTFATNQLQAVQMNIFFFLPSILLSGFMFPVAGMPYIIQWISSALPLTHYLIIVRGIILKGNSFLLIWPQIVDIMLFTVVIILMGMRRFRRTLD